ncbi:peptidase C39 family protein [Phytoactinopolyspora halotolerans]|uniref:Peptidase C39 family protein n=2 Tax=Phytoactinopolyspora halotolerans TaxID=1981512 RepID=A0A6L9S5U7_9ACTN|nr:peptidase C39 family protein [Phytoactinopolyspora halotolerans]
MMLGVAGTTSGVDVQTDARGRADQWEYATWTSPATELEFGASEVVASWGASTPGDSWISVEVQGTYEDGSTTPWYNLGNWDARDSGIERASVDSQSDGRSSVLVDTLVVGTQADGDPENPDDRDQGTAAPRDPGAETELDSGGEAGERSLDEPLLDAYQLRVTMYRPQGSLVMPRVWTLAAMASDVPDRTSVETSEGGLAWGEELNVPARSTNVHRDAYPEYGGGASWSSPAATTMVMEYFGVVPSREDMAWIDAGYTDPQVAHAARSVWDHALAGTGNWSFNAAYAATFPQLDAFVTRLRSLNDVERFIDAGIPVITSSLAFRASELDGANYGTGGHSMVVVGFTEDGDVIVNDPAARSNTSVRRVYDRAQFEEIWLRTERSLASGETGSGHGGVAQIIRPYDIELPDDDADASAPW